MNFLKVTAPVAEVEALVAEEPASEEPSRAAAEEPVCAFPAAQLAKDEDDVCNLWEIIKSTHSPAELLPQARGLMAALPDNERRKNLCGILIADYLDPEYSPVTFLLQETHDEPAPEDIRQSMIEVQLHVFALETWHSLLVNTKKRKTE